MSGPGTRGVVKGAGHKAMSSWPKMPASAGMTEKTLPRDGVCNPVPNVSFARAAIVVCSGQGRGFKPRPNVPEGDKIPFRHWGHPVFFFLPLQEGTKADHRWQGNMVQAC